MANYRPVTPMVQAGESKGWNQLPGHRGWDFRSQTRCATAADKSGESASALPCQLFRESCLELKSETGFTIRFAASEAALSSFDASLDVSRIEGSSEYCGDLMAEAESVCGEVGPSELEIPIANYMVPDQVLFFDDVALYAHEADCGKCKLSVKIRVMPDRFLVLLRLVQHHSSNGVRLVDTRCAHEFGEPLMLIDTEVRIVADAGPPVAVFDDATIQERFYNGVDPVSRANKEVRVMP